jgi:hypothetical protein
MLNFLNIRASNPQNLSAYQSLHFTTFHYVLRNRKASNPQNLSAYQSLHFTTFHYVLRNRKSSKQPYFPFPKKPNIPPHMPPIMWANWDTWSCQILLSSSLPTNKMATNINVTGISPDFTFVKDTKTINKNTIPLAPIKPVLKNIKFKMAVNMAVTSIMNSVCLDPYLSSMIGPSNNIKVILPIKCSKLTWPAI